MANTDYDVIIIGGGPAGLTAGMYAARARLNVVLFEKAAPGGQVIITDWVENYPGFPEGITGYDLGEKMVTQAKNLGLTIESDEITSMTLSREEKKVHLGSGKTVSAHTVIIASGASPRKLDIGEAKFMGKGVSFCATCDAPFFRDKVLVAVGGGDTAVQEAIYLTKFATKVYLVHRRDELRATKVLQERALKNDKIEMVWDSVVTGMDGFFNVENVHIKNVKTQAQSTIKADGCFIWVGTTPNTAYVKDNVKTDDGGFIFTDTHMETSIPGVYAIGDVRTTPLKQITTAVGDGAIAAMSAEHFIENLKDAK
ncbi:thioredoxin reductase (NADPH) [Desulfocicer vacuolatum DSM 3385]|uniref:Thioredoxin reductase n=1 Tax=Desulfocicer vacuolatum DSM 3385 TaxID=1121400 RepID=A0A1W2CHF4_9BACT|nr:thioredoxin-disulfide reductase [Desulfocicer vacuolatum]SMC84685.1 thioredoxin reductase (NADPH) [Desulfocicer vacuolatum DSM 3385]